MRSPLPSPPVLLGIALLVAVAVSDSDQIRGRAAAGLGRGMPPREAELARGFVLGEDEGIDAATKEDFRRAGLAHLLAVSGQNVTLLALLAMPLLAALGIPLRARLVWVLALIAVYVPVAGAGPSIQRAGVMGALGVLATLDGRRSSRHYALALAAGATLAVDPGVAGDVGWQLSFAAVLGILLLAPPLRRGVLARLGHGPRRRAVADCLALTVAATLATAPLVAHHFETLSTTALAANLLALPAVAPAMWLGMCVAALSQLPGLPLEPLNALSALLLGYVAQVASWCAAPEWAELHVHLGGGGLAASYLALAGAWLGAPALRRFGKGAAWKGPRARLAGPPAAAIALIAAILLSLSAEGASGPPARGLRIAVLDVGQGDAILLQPAAAPAVLVDGGPPSEGLAEKLEEAGVSRLGAAVVTHAQSDHAAGIVELFGDLPVDRLAFGQRNQRLLTAAAAAGVEAEQVAVGRELRSGELRLQVLWPPPELLAGSRSDDDPNQRSLVLIARWRGFSMLLAADAEAEAVPLDPGPVDVLKVAHHGSEDAGLATLLEQTRPKLAVISVGTGNPYGHPAPSTLATLARRQVPTLRTDREGDVVIEVEAGIFHLDG